MNDVDFITEAVGLLTRCSEAQRAQLAEMAQSFGQAENAGAMDARLDRRSDQDHTGKSISAMFPDLKRLNG